MASGMWVFGYGSLIWQPGFAYRHRQLASLQGYRRAFCMESHHYRGTPEQPGLVLALDPEDGGLCRGMAFEVEAANSGEVMDYLRRRELISDAYREAALQVGLDDGRQVQAVCYVMNRAHQQYAGELDLDEKARIIARASGSAGANSDYLFNTAQTLQDLGIADPEMQELERRVRQLLAR